MPFAFATLFWLHAAVGFAGEPLRETFITVADGPYCVINKAKLLCADVLKHLREVLKLPPGSQVRLGVEKDSTYESTAKVLELIKKSEYKTPMGYINTAVFPEQ
jgi:biopolymer transport protein ExbD